MIRKRPAIEKEGAEEPGLEGGHHDSPSYPRASFQDGKGQ